MHIGTSTCFAISTFDAVRMERKCVDGEEVCHRTSLALSTIPHDYDVTWT